MKFQIIEIRELAHVNLAIYSVDGARCATFVRKGESPTINSTPAAEQLVAVGGKLWKGGEKRRVYFNNAWELMGLKVRRYGTGNVAEASLNGEKISNSAARRFMAAHDESFYFDLVAGEWSDAELGAKIEEMI